MEGNQRHWEQDMDDERTRTPPFPDEARTGWIFISPCCTSSVREFSIDGTFWLAGHVANHGWSKPWIGRVQDINDTGTIVHRDGSEYPRRWRPGLS